MRNAFLRGVVFIYFVAFLSIYLQIEGEFFVSGGFEMGVHYFMFVDNFVGLYGTNGVTPAKAELNLQKRSADACYRDKHSILCFAPQYLGINSQLALELFALVGVAISSLG